jgi:parallel beta-helix repeat protein
MKFCNLLLSIVCLSCSVNAVAVTYYVNAQNGNDSWSGTLSTATTTNGPWQSISKVNATALQPGDQVLFSCGQTWYETLKPSTNGTSAAKIYFGSYPVQCQNKPKITGFHTILSSNWQPYQGNIWKSTFPQNLIANSTLSTSIVNWSKWPSDANQLFNSACPLSVAGCMNFLAGTSTNSSLIISNNFPVIGGRKYSGMVSFYAPSDTSVKFIVRESGNKYRSLGLSKKVIGNGKWQDINLEFISSNTLKARLDIEVPKNKRVYVRNAEIYEAGSLPKPSSVLFDGVPTTIAHHPNLGHDSSRPESVYLLTTAASPSVKDSTGRPGSSQIAVPALKLPAGGSIVPGTKLKLHELPYELNDFSVTSVNTNSVFFSPNTKYPLSNAGLGFYFYDAMWMLDSPGEWFFNTSTQTLYLWAPDNKNPSDKVTFSTLDTAINLKARLNLTVENLELSGVLNGVDISSTQNVKLQYLNLHNIDNNAITALNSINPTIANNLLNRVGMSGVSAKNSTSAIIQNNELTEVGIFLKSGKRISLPMTTDAAISGGSYATINDNLISNTGSFGIMSRNDSDIASNLVQRSCSSMNDCGAIYVYSISHRSVISNNLVLEMDGDMDGVTPEHAKHLTGIYLDNGVYGVSVTGNTIKGATSSIQLHNSNQNTISNNILYGAEDRLLWQQEDSIVNGGIYGNKVINNQIFPTTQYSVGIHNNTTSNYVEKFASFDNNHHSTIFSPIIATERGLKTSFDYKFLDWQRATTSAGTLRNNDLNGGTPAPLPSFARGTVGKNLVANGDFSSGVGDWDSWNAVAPKALDNIEGCLPVSVNCLHVTAGGSEGLVYSPKFAITKGKLYRVTFDLKSNYSSGYLHPVVRFAGPTNYVSLQKDTHRFIATTGWNRYSFIFEATDNAANPLVNNQGARFDISGLPSGKSLWITNLELMQFDLGTLGTPRTDMLVNSTDINKTIDCPTRASNPSLCTNFVVFPESTVAVWPVSVPPRSGRIVFTQNFKLLDTDSDGIANSQDQCSNTGKGLTVNGKGCSLSD